MVNYSDIGKINQLSGERRRIEMAVRNFDTGGRITELTVSPNRAEDAPEEARGGMPVTIQTEGMAYAPAMVEAIKAGLRTRLTAIEQELTGLGLTGVAETRGQFGPMMGRRGPGATGPAGPAPGAPPTPEHRRRQRV